ncbi:hypothetical protein NUU61_009692 [Penicillium alfredii]|uniref:JmjC domain-containing protein n=1 Tax=Penicillium alfredii TaxID=1506179 RepID=A0A9W9EGK6_9EURO|nr:uncharacterized protein NUU61_009692 [Penicillium alfredii]KAJ5081428.1 hypothetical protein NUU61_009692 [Penicillium alfredii]
MPTQRTRAVFEPFPPNLDIGDLVDSTPKFNFAWRITCDSIDENPREDFEQLVLFHVILSGRPLVIEGFQKRLDKFLFSEKWLRQNCAGKKENARDLVKGTNLLLTIGHYLKNLPLLTEQWTPYNYTDRDRQRLYLKDIDCPPEWCNSLGKLIPPCLFYLNEFPKPFDGPGSQLSDSSPPPNSAQGVPIARAGDLMSCLPERMRAENLMCYVGHEGTYTPAHQEMCASLGQNIMVEASDGSVEHGKQTRPGSSIWFMTETKDRHAVAEYWMSFLGHDIDIEDHFAQLNAWTNAPFKTFVVEQRPGDLVLIPPLAAHQVWNRGTRTMKVAWNRTTVDTLEMALCEALPHARMVCRDEQYKNKAIVYYTLEKYSNLLWRAHKEEKKEHPEVKQLLQDFKRLFMLYTEVLLSETFPPRKLVEKEVEYVEFEGNVTCSYCRCNIFNRFLTCPWCVETFNVDGEEISDTYDICMDCFVMGRSCRCVSRLKWAEQFRWKEILGRYEHWRQLILTLDEGSQDEKQQQKLKTQFPAFTIARGQMGRKSLAEICQEELIRRPWIDIKKPNPAAAKKLEASSDSEDNGQSRKRRKVRHRAKAHAEETGRCHVCREPEASWKRASCSRSTCEEQYCYSCLFRAFDISPRDVMEKHHWWCPKCQKICSCNNCRRDPTMSPHEPRGTLLGHDTRKIADPRSVESLVNLRLTNFRWLNQFGSDNASRVEKRLKEAEEKRTQALRVYEIDLESSPLPMNTHTGDFLANYEAEIPVDPGLELDNTLRMLV